MADDGEEKGLGRQPVDRRSADRDHGSEGVPPRVGRRRVLGGAALALAGATAGTVLGSAGPASAASGPALPPPGPQRNASGRGEVLARAPGGVTTLENVSFGWEVHPLENNGADVYFAVAADMVLEVADVDTALMILSLPASPGFVEVLCTGWVSRGGPPQFVGAPHVYGGLPASADFGGVTVYNPNNLTVGVGPVTPGAGGFYAVIMKSWVPADGSASSTHRHVHATPALELMAGDYLAFHMDQAGVPCDAEMQVALAYRRI